MDAGATRRPRFKAGLKPVVVAGDGLFLLSERGHAWLRDPVFAALGPLLDGCNEAEAIFSALAHRYPSSLLLAALDHLRLQGHLAEDIGSGPQPERAFWEFLGVPPATAQSRLAAARVTVSAVGDVDAHILAELLRGQGVTIAPDGDIAAVVADDYLRPELAAHNARALAQGQAWLLIKPVGLETWTGPFFVPGQTACWECLAQRLRGHRRLHTYLAARTGGDAPLGAPAACIPAVRHRVLAEAATELVRWIGTDGPSNLAGRIGSTNTLTMETTWHALTRRPQCPVCGAPARIDRRPLPVRLTQRRKIASSDNGCRAREPATVLAELDRHVSPITGVIGAIVPGERTRHAGGGRWITPIFAADHNFSDMHDERFFLHEGLRLRSGGKGRTAEQARLSALGESLERYSGVFDGTEPRIRASFAALNGAAIHPDACTAYSSRQYAERERHNARGHKAHWVAEPFREDAEIEWTPLWSLTDETVRHLPTSFCYFGYRADDPVFARADSNGCAAGSVLEEAILQGLLELIERDAVALWWYNRVRRPEIDLGSVDDPYVAALVRHYLELRRELWVLDVTSDFGIATFAALSRRTDQQQEDVIYGFGAHLDPAVALTRALTELNQSLEAVPAASGPDEARTYRGGEDAVRWWRSVRIADAAYLRPDPNAPRRPIQDVANLASDDIREDVLLCKDLAASRGVEVLVLDQTRPDIGLPVVRVVAPGLRHFWARFGPGRLYDVPVLQGWLPRPLAEDELNPFVVQF